MHKQSIHVDAREELVGVGSLHPTRGSISLDSNHLKLWELVLCIPHMGPSVVITTTLSC